MVHVRVGLWRRLAAFALDLIFSVIFTLLFMFMFGALRLVNIRSVHWNINLETILDGIQVGMGIGYYVVAFFYLLTEAFTGMTLGKRLLNLEVGMVGGHEGTTAFYMKRFAIRNFSVIIGLLATIAKYFNIFALGLPLEMFYWLSVSIFIVGCFLTFGKRKQALHDLLAGSAVYERGTLTEHGH